MDRRPPGGMCARPIESAQGAPCDFLEGETDTVVECQRRRTVDSIAPINPPPPPFDIAHTEVQTEWNEICLDLYTIRPCHPDTDGRPVNTLALSRERRQSMRTCFTSWLHAALLCATVLDPLDTTRTAGRLLPSELPSLSQPPHMSLRLPRTSRGALATTNRPLRTTPAAPRQRMNIALARYTTSHPPTFHPRSPAPILDDEGKLRILFIGPGQASTGVTPSQTPGARLAEASAFAPDLSPSLNHRPPSTIMGEMPYEGNEYGRMNDASHLVLHGGN